MQTRLFIHVALWHKMPLPSTGESDENDARLGPVSRPGGDEPQRSLEAIGHLCLQHGADPLRGGNEQVPLLYKL